MIEPIQIIQEVCSPAETVIRAAGMAVPMNSADTSFISTASVPPARPGHLAEREELDAALKAGTREALMLFIDRHPQSRYLTEAEEALRHLEPSAPSPFKNPN